MVTDRADGEDDTTATGPPSLDAAFELLADRRRRTTLRCLAEHAPSIALADLAEEVAVRETGRPIPQIDPEEVLEIYLSLYHVHIPKLADAAVVKYVQERDLVSLHDDAAALDRLLSLADGRLADW